jgi:hypothetical protein
MFSKAQINGLESVARSLGVAPKLFVKWAAETRQSFSDIAWAYSGSHDDRMELTMKFVNSDTVARA